VYGRQKTDDRGMEGTKDKKKVMDEGTKEMIFFERLKL